MLKKGSLRLTFPAQCHAKINDLRTLFLNFHELINEFRPHQVLAKWHGSHVTLTSIFTQARETLRLILETQINGRRKAKQDLDEFDLSMLLHAIN